MKAFLSTLLLAALLTGSAAVTAITQNVPAQNTPARILDDHSNVLQSQITLGVDYPPIVRKAFLSSTVMPLPKGTVLPSVGILGSHGMDRMLSVRHQFFTIGPRTLRYPIIGMMRCANFPYTGEFVRVIASNTVIRQNLKAGEVLHSGGLVLEAKRAFHAGETIPSIRILFQHKQLVFSIEETPDAVPQPVLSIAQENLHTEDRDIALEAWRLSNQSARMGGLN